MKAGTSKAPKYIPVHAIQMVLSSNPMDWLIAFHAIIGSDSVSRFGGHGKKTVRKVFQKHPAKLAGFGKGLALKHSDIVDRKIHL